MICFPYDDSFIFLLSLIGGSISKTHFVTDPNLAKNKRNAQ